jgi:glycosyltransferase involved in cell wall biosynthesis
MTSISVVLCTYNGAAFLAEQLASVAGQTRVPDEMVVRDDGSTDETMQVLEDFAAAVAFPVSIAKNPVRLGAFANFWSAVHEATGDLVALCDQDDVWMPSKLERAIELLDGDPKVGATFSDGWCIDDVGALTGRSLWDCAYFTTTERERFESGEELEVLLRHPVVTGATLTFRPSLLPVLAPPPEMPHDYWLSVAVAMRAPVVPIRASLIKYRLHDANTAGLPGQKSLSFHRLRYVVDPKYRRQTWTERLAWMEALSRLLGDGPCPRLTKVQKELLKSRIEKLRFGLSLPENLWHRVSFVRR